MAPDKARRPERVEPRTWSRDGNTRAASAARVLVRRQAPTRQMPPLTRRESSRLSGAGLDMGGAGVPLEQILSNFEQCACARKG